MALYIPHSIFHLARLLYVRPETFEPYYVRNTCPFFTELFQQTSSILLQQDISKVNAVFQKGNGIAKLSEYQQPDFLSRSQACQEPEPFFW